MNFDFNLAKSTIPTLINASFTTIKISILSTLIGLIVGTIFAYLNTKKNIFLDFFINTYVLIIRGTPMLIQISFFYYVLPIAGIKLSSFLSASFAIGLNSAGYMSQTIKSGISSVSKNQIDAAKTLGLSNIQTFRYIIFPQAIKVIYPTISNETTTLIKDSSLASTIGVIELYKESRNIMNYSYDVFTTFILMSIFYLILTSITTLFFNLIEKKAFNNVNN